MNNRKQQLTSLVQTQIVNQSNQSNRLKMCTNPKENIKAKGKCFVRQQTHTRTQTTNTNLSHQQTNKQNTIISSTETGEITPHTQTNKQTSLILQHT